MSNEQTVTVASHEFVAKPVNSLIVKYAGSTLIGMLAQSIMVIFEGIMIGNGLGADGLACVGLIMPLENLHLAIGTGFGIGLTTIAGIKLGQGDEKGARDAFGAGHVFITVLMLLLGLCLITFPAPIARFLGTPDKYMPLMIPFIRIFGVGYPFCGFAQTVVGFLRMDERPGLATAAMTVTAVAGVIWLYYVCFISNLGIAGTGWYYAFSIGGWSLFGIPMFLDKKSKFRFKAKDLHIDFKLGGEAIKIAFPYICSQVSISLFTIIINNILIKIGTDLHIAAYAVISGYIIYILNMFTMSVSTGTTPIVSYNLGEKLFDRLKKLMTNCVYANVLSVAIVTIIFEIFAKQVCWILCGDAALVEVALPAVHIVILAAALGSSLTVMSGYFEAVYKLIPATIAGIGRYLILATACMFILVYIAGLGVNGVWYGLFAADILSFAVCLIMMASEKRCLDNLKKLKGAN
ncbi:MAG: multidrug transporter MatE [Paenibacillaceae bacterium]|nr:multidrug transporter MatE [Paenibacillaceae bacterium]